MVNVQVSPLSPFEENVFSLAASPVQQLRNVARIGSKLLAISKVLICNLVVIQRLGTQKFF